jgi:hypothetical protein
MQASIGDRIVIAAATLGSPYEKVRSWRCVVTTARRQHLVNWSDDGHQRSSRRRAPWRHHYDRATGVIEAVVAGRTDEQPLHFSVGRCADHKQLRLLRFSHEFSAG